MQDFLAAFLLLGHTAFAAIMWRRPRIVTGVSSGVALGLLALTKAVFQYWLVGIAVVLFTGLWLETDRRRTLLPACVALVLAALAVTTPWMARNAVEVGHFGISGRDGEVLAIRAEYGRMNWSEVPGAFAYWLREFPGIPAHTRVLNSVRRWLEPETGYTNFDRDNPDGYYRRAKLMAGAVAARADQIDSEWWSSQVKCDSVLRQASVELMRVDWRKHVALTPAFAVRGAGAMGAGVLGLLVVPAFITVLLVAWKRRDIGARSGDATGPLWVRYPRDGDALHPTVRVPPRSSRTHRVRVSRRRRRTVVAIEEQRWRRDRTPGVRLAPSTWVRNRRKPAEPGHDSVAPRVLRADVASCRQPARLGASDIRSVGLAG